LVVDSDVEHIVASSLNEGSRKHTVHENGGSRETVRRNVGVGDVESVVDVRCKYSGEESKLGKESETGSKKDHFARSMCVSVELQAFKYL
jgi:hypothetical protein